MEEGGPPGPKIARFLYFIGAGFICTVGINKWRELERKSLLKQQQQQQQQPLTDLLPQSSSNVVQKATK